MSRLKVYYCKLGTMPARLNFRYAYKFRVGQLVQFRELDRLGQANPHWFDGVVEQTEPHIRVSRR